MKCTYSPSLIITLASNDINYECERKPHTNYLFINDNSELKAESEIKVEADLNLDDIQTENTIFATELDILENINSKNNIKEERKLVSEKKENQAKNHQQVKKRKKKSEHHTSKKIKLKASETSEPCTSRVLELKSTSDEQISDGPANKRPHKQISDETNETYSEDFDERSDYDNTDSDYEMNVASK